MVKVFKIEIMFIDFDNLGDDEAKSVIENTRYPNYCMSPEVKKIESREVEWSDEHPLNNSNTSSAEYERLFGN